MEQVIIIKDVKKIYQVGFQEVNALAGLNLTINKNEFVAIMGPSGSGKSTLMNIIGCLDTPSHGEYWLNGNDVSQLQDEALAAIRNKEIGFIFQTFNLLSRYNAIENVAVPLIYAGINRPERIEMAKAALTQVGLHDRMDHKPNEMSGGQRQRVAIARALVNTPSIILADEPTGNLDSKTSVEIMRLLGDLHRKGNTIVLVTHEEEIALNAKRIVRLRDGIIEIDEVVDRYNKVKNLT
ncbi:MAG: macrolide ABC transporter ATP-binding protein [Bacteroidetes bacterium HGW-Bacteroidetes-4]|jgi:putative ABC transport system ATP-binding protein|nr:MAG: macrolide ABC transporter ATP-binding protein [Bacteroidetes bacterium HGW-Bacteroidetes-4]